MPDIRELWEYRELLGILILRDIKVRYKQTVLGGAWVILRPLLSAGIFTVIFGNLAKIPSDGFPYAIFVFSALLPWTFFSNSVTASVGSLVGSSGLIGKVYFPRIIIPLAAVMGGLIDLAISLAFLLAFMPFFGISWTMHLLAAPVVLLGILLIAFGVGTVFSALNVAYRDVGGLIQLALQIWMFATPVVYPASMVPENWRWVLHLNPMAALIEGFRSVFLGRPPDMNALGISFLTGVILLTAGVAYFEKVERRFADII